MGAVPMGRAAKMGAPLAGARTGFVTPPRTRWAAGGCRRARPSRSPPHGHWTGGAAALLTGG